MYAASFGLGERVRRCLDLVECERDLVVAHTVDVGGQPTHTDANLQIEQELACLVLGRAECTKSVRDPINVVIGPGPGQPFRVLGATERLGLRGTAAQDCHASARFLARRAMADLSARRA